MKVRAFFEGLAVPATIDTANLAKDTLVSMTADRAVDAAGADDRIIGRLVKPSKVAGGSGTIETRFKELIEIKSDGAVAAGDVVKMSSDSPAGTQRMKKWVSQTDLVAGDPPDTALGICWKGGTNATIEVLLF